MLYKNKIDTDPTNIKSRHKFCYLFTIKSKNVFKEYKEKN